jgi:hypothetical protein
VALHRFSSATRSAQILFQPGAGVFEGGVALPIREIGDVIFADFFRQISCEEKSQRDLII